MARASHFLPHIHGIDPSCLPPLSACPAEPKAAARLSFCLQFQSMTAKTERGTWLRDKPVRPVQVAACQNACEWEECGLLYWYQPSVPRRV